MEQQTQKPDMGEVIKNILQAEERAAEIAEQAKAESRQKLADAEARAAEIKARAEEDVKRELMLETEQISAEVARQSALAQEECEGEKRRLAELAKNNSAAAVKIILEQLSEKYAG